MSAKTILQQAMDSQPVQSSKEFASTMKPVIGKAIEVKRAEVGANMFRPKGGG